MIKRPKPGDNEEDILRMQEEYLCEKNKNKNFEPAAKVVNIGEKEQSTVKQSASNENKRKPSKYAQAKGLKNHAEKRVKFDVPSTSLVGDILEKNTELSSPSAPDLEDVKDDDKVYYPSIIPSLLGRIVEKNIDSYTDFNLKPTMPPEGFPVVLKHDHNEKIIGQSIFSYHTSKNCKEDVNVSTSMETDMDTSCAHKDLEIDSLNIPLKSYIVTSSDAEIIHKENIHKLSKMTQNEILAEQQKLLCTLDPKLIEFLKSKRKNKLETTKPQSNNTDISKAKGEAMDVTEVNKEENTDDTLWDNDILLHPNVNKWIHFNSLEKDKLAWTKSIKDCCANTDKPYEARFNFSGYLMPYTVEYTEETKTLFHHGEEPHRPGYSLTELFQLSRSTVTQQRVMALNSLAGILEYYMAGTYDGIIEIPLSKIFFVLRFSLDENKTIILEPALKALRNLFYNRIDEASLDALIGFEEGTQQPCLENDKSEIKELDSEEAEFKDFHLAEIDLITAALRSDIIQRIYYILNSVKPSFNCVHYSLQILTRLVRDSLDTARMLIDTEHLMQTIIENFIPISSINFTFEPQIAYNGKPVIAALKLIRILSLQSKEVTNILIEKYNILKPLCEYISSEVDGTYGLRIQTESLCILTNVLHFRVGVEQVLSLLPLVVTALYKHVHGTDVLIDSSIPSATHAAVILQLINKVLKFNLNELDKVKLQLYPLIKDGAMKWLSQISHADAFTCGHLCLLCSVLDCCKTLVNCDPSLIPTVAMTLKIFATSPGFNMIVSKLIISSNLLSGIEDKCIHRDKNLMSLGVSIVTKSQIVLPVLSVTSPVPFLASLFKLLEGVNQSEVSGLFVEKVLEYLNRIKNEAPSLSDNWFTRVEIVFVFTIVKLLVTNETISETQKDLLYAVSNKLCYLLKIDMKAELEFLLDSIVFNKTWFTAARLMNLIALSETNFSFALSSVEDIKRCYSSVINLGYKDTGPNIVLRNWRDPILPRDWIYLPILDLYSKSQDLMDNPKVIGEHAKRVQKLENTEKQFIITCSLEWIIFNELCFPELLKDIDITDRFCRIMCIFLCDNSLFLDEKIQSLLNNCLQVLFKEEKKLSFNFDKPLTGLHNFQDFYTQFLEQFQAVSYGDHNFAASVLVPLAQKHNPKWRKLLWSEYAGCLRALDCPEERLCYDMEQYLSPEETDKSLIKSYSQALNGSLLRPNTVAHRIASHHVMCYKNRTSDSSNIV